MTKKHFEMLANELKATKPNASELGVSAVSPEYTLALKQWEYDVKAVIRVCLAFNPKFSTVQFSTAVGYGLTNR